MTTTTHNGTQGDGAMKDANGVAIAGIARGLRGGRGIYHATPTAWDGTFEDDNYPEGVEQFLCDTKHSGVDRLDDEKNVRAITCVKCLRLLRGKR